MGHPSKGGQLIHSNRENKRLQQADKVADVTGRQTCLSTTIKANFAERGGCDAANNLECECHIHCPPFSLHTLICMSKFTKVNC